MGDNKHIFQKLTPVDSVDLALYEEALDFFLTIPTLEMSPFQVHTVLAKVVF